MSHYVGSSFAAKRENGETASIRCRRSYSTHRARTGLTLVNAPAEQVLGFTSVHRRPQSVLRQGSIEIYPTDLHGILTRYVWLLGSAHVRGSSELRSCSALRIDDFLGRGSARAVTKVS